MEREFKFIFPAEVDKNYVYDYVFNNSYIKSLMEKDNVKKIKMFSRYFDFNDRRLRKNGITLRHRKENDSFVTTVKYGGGTKNGLHERNEVNVVSDSEVLDLILLKEKVNCKFFFDLLSDGSGLREQFGAEFIRNSVLIHEVESDTTMELALDTGYLFNYNSENREKICELELELLSGCDEVFKSIGKQLIYKLKMQPFNKSKASRAAAL